jgi:hypothetical protein
MDDSLRCESFNPVGVGLADGASTQGIRSPQRDAPPRRAGRGDLRRQPRQLLRLVKEYNLMLQRKVRRAGTG